MLRFWVCFCCRHVFLKLFHNVVISFRLFLFLWSSLFFEQTLFVPLSWRFIFRSSFYLFALVSPILVWKTFRLVKVSPWTKLHKKGKLIIHNGQCLRKQITSCLMRQVYPVRGLSHNLACVQIPALHNSPNIADNPPRLGRPPRCQCASESDQRGLLQIYSRPMVTLLPSQLYHS